MRDAVRAVLRVINGLPPNTVRMASTRQPNSKAHAGSGIVGAGFPALWAINVNNFR